jgi:hypothetical protein
MAIQERPNMRHLDGDPTWTYRSEPSDGDYACIGVWGRHVYAVFCGHFVTDTDKVNMTTDLVVANVKGKVAYQELLAHHRKLKAAQLPGSFEPHGG